MSSSGSSPILDIVTKYVLPTVTQTLITASQDLIAPSAHVRSKPLGVAETMGEDPSIILDDTTNYISTHFNTNFGYEYNHQDSFPLNMIPTETGVLLGAGEFVGFYSNDDTQMQTYVNAMFTDTIFPDDKRIGAQFMHDFLSLISSQMDQGSDSWVPFNTTKLYTLVSDPTKTVEIDLQATLFTASSEESVIPGKPSAFLNYALTAYYTTV